MKWVSAFSYLPINFSIQLAKVSDQTQRITFTSNLSGDKVRLRLSNCWSHSALTMRRVTVGIVQEDGTASAVSVTKDGNSTISLAPGEECWSDEIDLCVHAGDRLAIHTYVDEEQLIESVCSFWSTEGPEVLLSDSGDYTDGSCFEGCPHEKIYQVIAEDVNKGFFFYGISGLQVNTSDNVKTIAMFGDSITHMSYVSNALFKRLSGEYAGKAALLNCGIGGNRLLHDATAVDTVAGNGACFGTAGIMRFEQDVFGLEQVDAVIVLEGINDIMHAIQFNHPEEMITPDELVCGYQYLMAIARKHGARIYGATITPCGHESYPEDWLAQFEAVRTRTNERIRSGIGYDGWFDYDAAVRDEQKTDYMRTECHIHDGLHPNDFGGSRMADCIDLAMIMGEGGM